MNVHVVDGTYELFRHYYALPSVRDADGREVAAVRGAAARDWRVTVAQAERLAETLRRERERALLFRKLATLRTNIALFDDVESLRWNGRFD